MVLIDVVLTPIMVFTKLEAFEVLLFTVINDDAANPVEVVIETSEDGVASDAERIFQLTVPPISAGTPNQRTLEILDNIRGWYRVSATATGAPVAARWSLKGVPRHL